MEKYKRKTAAALQELNVSLVAHTDFAAALTCANYRLAKEKRSNISFKYYPDYFVLR